MSLTGLILFLTRIESEMLNLKSSEIHWVFPTVSEIGWILCPRVNAKPSVSQHTDCSSSGAERAVTSEHKQSRVTQILQRSCSFQLMLDQFIKVLNLFERVPLLMGLFILKDIKATFPTDVIFHPLRMNQVSISFLLFV